MEAERLNQTATLIDQMRARIADLRGYL